ncbi:MAG: GatB/YqeY domain-containing protein [Arenimonas sp.]
MSLKARLTDDMKAAMKGGEKERLLVIRTLNAAIKQREVDERIELDDSQVLSVLDKQVKQRRDSLTQFEAAGRHDLAAVERFELGVIQGYLPQQMAADELAGAVAAAIVQSGAAGPQDMGKVMAVLKPMVAGRADMGALSGLVKAALAK